MTIIYSTSHSPAFNLAAEEFLFSTRHDDLLFLYVNKPSVIIGCNQAIRNEVNLQFCAENRILIVRRMSGGGAVFHDEGNLNFCFITNKTEGILSLNSDSLLPVIEVLKAMYIPVETGSRRDLWLPGGYKITGTASHCNKYRELHHGTLLYDTNLDFLVSSLTVTTNDPTIKAIVSVRSEVKNLKAFLEDQGRYPLNTTDFFLYLIGELAKIYGVNSISDFLESEISFINEIEEQKYKSTEWTFKK